MEKITGTVTSVSQKGDKYGFTIGLNNWYNGFGQCPCKRGDKVEVEYEVNNNFKNIKNLKVLESAPEKENLAEVNAVKRRAMDCVLAAEESFRSGAIKKEEVAEHAMALHDLAEKIAQL